MSSDLQREIATALNRACAENESNTPDWLLAQFMLSCLAAFNTAVQQRETWYGRDARPSYPGAPIVVELSSEPQPAYGPDDAEFGMSEHRHKGNEEPQP